MPNLTEHKRSLIVGMLMAGVSVSAIAQRMQVHRDTVRNTQRNYQLTGSTKELKRSGRPRITTPGQDRYIRTQHLRHRFRPATETASTIPGLRRI